MRKRATHHPKERFVGKSFILIDCRQHAEDEADKNHDESKKTRSKNQVKSTDANGVEEVNSHIIDYYTIDTKSLSQNYSLKLSVVTYFPHLFKFFLIISKNSCTSMSTLKSLLTP